MGKIKVSPEEASSLERERRAALVEKYKQENPVKAAEKKRLGKEGKLISLDDWVKEA